MLLCTLAVLAVQAQGWNEQQYKQIEQSIREPQFAAQEFPITKYGAKVTNTAKKNQKAIQKAIDTCSKKGGGRVIVPAGLHFLTGSIELKNDTAEFVLLRRDTMALRFGDRVQGFKLKPDSLTEKR